MSVWTPELNPAHQADHPLPPSGTDDGPYQYPVVYYPPLDRYRRYLDNADRWVTPSPSSTTESQNHREPWVPWPRTPIPTPVRVESADAPVTAPADSMQSERPHGGEPEAPGGLSGEAGSRRHTTQLMANQPVVIEETFKHMMRLREARHYGETWGTKPTHWTKYGFIIIFILLMMFGSVTFSSTETHNTQMIATFDWNFDTFSFIASLCTVIAFLLSSLFAKLLFWITALIITIIGFITWAAGGSLEVPIFRNWCQDQDTAWDTVTCPYDLGCRMPVKNATWLAPLASAVGPDRGTPAPTLYFINGTQKVMYTCNARAQSDGWRYFILSVLVVVSVPVMLYSAGRWLYLFAIRKGWLDKWLPWLFRLKQTGLNCWEYQPLGHHHRHLEYVGELDDENYPDGMGSWMDSDYHGERLYGHFKNGIPIGPFISAEMGTGFSFANVRVGLAQCRAEKGWEKSRALPQHAELQLSVGAVTCCTTGRFYTHLPAGELLFPLRSVKECAAALEFTSASEEAATVRAHTRSATKGMDDLDWFHALVGKVQHLVPEERHLSSVVVAVAPDSGLIVEGHHSPADTSRVLITVAHGNEGSAVKHPELHIHHWQRNADADYEVLLLFPGFNNACKHACQTFGQLLALGDFPPQIKPFVFSWPAGQILTYYKSKESAGSAEVAESFRQLLGLFLGAGFRMVHVLAHSMGARAWVSCFWHCRDMFTDVGATQQGGELKLASVILMNGEYPVRAFVEKDLAPLQSKCSHISVYGNRNDGALMWAQVFNDPRHFGKEQEKSVGRAVNHLDPSVDGPDEPLWKKALEEDKRALMLEVDVIDTTLLESNVHKTKHSYYNLNREIVEDLRDIIITHRRAAGRARLRRMKHGSNVFQFLVAPPSVVNA